MTLLDFYEASVREHQRAEEAAARRAHERRTLGSCPCGHVRGEDRCPFCDDGLPDFRPPFTSEATNAGPVRARRCVFPPGAIRWLETGSAALARLARSMAAGQKTVVHRDGRRKLVGPSAAPQGVAARRGRPRTSGPLGGRG